MRAVHTHAYVAVDSGVVTPSTAATPSTTDAPVPTTITIGPEENKCEKNKCAEKADNGKCDVSLWDGKQWQVWCEFIASSFLDVQGIIIKNILLKSDISLSCSL